MKGVVGELGEMKIELKPDAKPINKRPNEYDKEQVKQEIDKMLAAGLLSFSSRIIGLDKPDSHSKQEDRLAPRVDFRRLNERKMGIHIRIYVGICICIHIDIWIVDIYGYMRIWI